jgi:chromosome segregation ATPase
MFRRSSRVVPIAVDVVQENKALRDQCKKLQHEVNVREEWMETYRDELKVRDAWIKRYQDELKARDAWITEYQRQSEMIGKSYLDLKDRLCNTNTELDKKTASYTDLQERLCDVNTELDEKEYEIEDLQDELERLQKPLEKLFSWLQV